MTPATVAACLGALAGTLVGVLFYEEVRVVDPRAVRCEKEHGTFYRSPSGNQVLCIAKGAVVVVLGNEKQR